VPDYRGGELRSPEDLAFITGGGRERGTGGGRERGIILRDFTLAAAGGTRIPVGTPCWIEFMSDAVILQGPTARDHVRYDTIQDLQVSGSTVKSNARLFGGGFGVIGAAEGILAATVINTLTQRTKRYAVIRIVTRSAEYVFSSGTRDGSALALALTSVQVQIRKAQPAAQAVPSAPQPSLGSVADELRKLASLRDEGILTQEEFAAAKAKLLGG
jgi:Short C-terminal domain